MRIKDILGMEVFDSECRILGIVTDIEFTSNAKFALIIEAEDGESKIPFEKIGTIGDKIILKKRRRLKVRKIKKKTNKSK